MTNREYILSKHTKEELLNLLIVFFYNDISVDKTSLEFLRCSKQKDCEGCVLCLDDSFDCKNLDDWLDEEFKEPEVDWTKIPVDTLIETSLDGIKWYKRHFVGVVNGMVITCTNDSTYAENKYSVTGWEYARLIKE